MFRIASRSDGAFASKVGGLAQRLQRATAPRRDQEQSPGSTDDIGTRTQPGVNLLVRLESDDDLVATGIGSDRIVDESDRHHATSASESQL